VTTAAPRSLPLLLRFSLWTDTFLLPPLLLACFADRWRVVLPARVTASLYRHIASGAAADAAALLPNLLLARAGPKSFENAEAKALFYRNGLVAAARSRTGAIFGIEACGDADGGSSAVAAAAAAAAAAVRGGRPGGMELRLCSSSAAELPLLRQALMQRIVAAMARVAAAAAAADAAGAATKGGVENAVAAAAARSDAAAARAKAEHDIEAALRALSAKLRWAMPALLQLTDALQNLDECRAALRAGSNGVATAEGGATTPMSALDLAAQHINLVYRAVALYHLVREQTNAAGVIA